MSSKRAGQTLWTRPSVELPVHAGGPFDTSFVQPQVVSFMNRNLDTTYWLNWPACWRTCLGILCLPLFAGILLLVLSLFGVLTIPVLHGF